VTLRGSAVALALLIAAAVQMPSMGAEQAAQPKPTVLTLEQALAIALENNPGLSIAKDQVGAARGRLGQAKARALPQVTGAGTWTQQGPVTSFTIPGPPGQPPETITLGQSRTRSAVLTLTQPLDLAGQIRAAKRMASLGLTSAAYGVDRTANDLALSVYNAYYGVLRARDSVTVAQQAVDASQEHLRIAEAQFRAGTAPQFDVLRASVQLENDRQTLVQAQNAQQLALANLVNILGLDPTTAIDVAPVVQMPSPQPTAPAQPATPAAPATPPPSPAAQEVPSYNEALQEAYANRPEVRQAQTAVQTAQAALAAAKATGRPDVAIVGNYVYTPDASGFVAVQHSWNISANLSIPVFTSGLVHARIREAQANLKAAQDALTQAQQGVGLDVRSAILNIHNAEERRRTAAANVTQAAEALRIARVRFESGVSTLVEVTDAEVALTQARTNQVNAEYDYLVAQANLKKATGALLSSVRAALGVDAK